MGFISVQPIYLCIILEVLLMKVVVKTNNLSREEWLKYRTKGIGGSDVSIIAGINPFKSAHQLWLEKTGQIEPEQTDVNTHISARS